MKIRYFLITLLIIAAAQQTNLQAGSTGKSWGIGLGAACGGALLGSAIANSNNRARERELQYQQEARWAAEEDARYEARRAREERERSRRLERQLRQRESRENIDEVKRMDRLTFDEDLYM
jgi:uncharacterized membrane protein YqiK